MRKIEAQMVMAVKAAIEGNASATGAMETLVELKHCPDLGQVVIVACIATSLQNLTFHYGVADCRGPDYGCWLANSND